MELLQAILEEVSGVLDRVEPQEMEDAMAMIRKDHPVFVDGEGRSGLMAKGFAMRLMHLGYPVYVVGETITPAVESGSLFVAVSGSGTSANVLSDVRKAKKNGAKILAVTSKPDSPLGQEGDGVLTVPGTVKGEVGERRGSIQLLSSLFDQSLHLVLDALCLMISRRDGTSNEKATAAHW
jgi:6-phospho-3-hexuloisomerase